MNLKLRKKGSKSIERYNVLWYYIFNIYFSSYMPFGLKRKEYNETLSFERKFE